MRAAEAYTRLATKSGQRYSIPSNCAKPEDCIFLTIPTIMKLPETDSESAEDAIGIFFLYL